jgi:ferredoxin
MPYVVYQGCILCGACSAGCPSDAITEDETQAHIDVDICVECGTCERNCPSEAILFVEEGELESLQPSKEADEVSSS